LVAATRRRSATARILVLVVVVIAVATAIVWGLNEANRTPPPATIAANSELATRPAPVVVASPTAPAIQVATASPSPTATVPPTPAPTPSPTPPPTATPEPTATPLPTMTPTPVVLTGCVEPEALPAVTGPTLYVAETGINLRQQPGLNCVIVVPIQPFTEITPLSGPVQADGLAWIKVEVAGFTGWVATDFIREPANG
jgi:hypothetical protein